MSIIRQHPRSNAANVYDLLRDVQEIIREEPRRFSQVEWIRNRQVYLADPVDKFGTCGTRACVAGWMVILVDGVTNMTPWNVEWRATCLLVGRELNANEDDDKYRDDFEFANPLFSGGAIDNLFRDGDLEVAPVGTYEYAEAGVRHIQGFLDENEDRLRDTPVLPPKDRRQS